MTDRQIPPPTQLRVVVEADDFDEATRFYRDALGLRELAAFSEGGDARVLLLDVGRATLELANPAHKRFIDDVEAQGRPSPRIRLAFEVADADGVTRAAEAGGAHVVAQPTLTPWHSRNARLDAPAGLQITLFQEHIPPESPSDA